MIDCEKGMNKLKAAKAKRSRKAMTAVTMRRRLRTIDRFVMPITLSG
jgi:hypothetical protein